MPKIATNFEVGSAQPIDTRFVVQSESDLANLKVYEGLEVYIKDLKAKRLYNGTDWIEVTGGVDEEEVMEIVEENGEEAEFAEIEELQSADIEEVDLMYSVGTSETIDINSDSQLVTSKAAKKLIDNALGEIETLLEAI